MLCASGLLFSEVNGVAVRIRLKRLGAKKRPFYRIVVADSRSPRDGRIIEAIGHYDPMTDPRRVEVDAEKALSWLQKGALPSDTARRLLTEAGVLGGKEAAAEPTNDREQEAAQA